MEYLSKINCSAMLSRMENLTMPMEKDILLAMKYYLYGIIMPTVCVFGFVGNVLNIFVFSWKRNQRIMDEIERCTTTCLMALATSDMMFCICVFPNAFLPERNHFDPAEFMLYYKAFSIAIIDVFIFTSTMLTVITAIMRYLAICHPFQSTRLVSMKNTASAITVTFVLAIGINVPQLWRYHMSRDPCLPMDDNTMILLPVPLYHSEAFEYAYRMVWAILGNFIPLIILLYCNVRLIRALRRSKQLRTFHSRDTDTFSAAHRRITITLVTIIILFFILVAPSEIVKFVLRMTKHETKEDYTFQMASMIINVLQSINFSVNFILYYVIIAPFRKTLNQFVCLNKRGSESSNYGSMKQHTILLISFKDKRNNTNTVNHRHV